MPERVSAEAIYIAYSKVLPNPQTKRWCAYRMSREPNHTDNWNCCNRCSRNRNRSVNRNGPSGRNWRVVLTNACALTCRLLCLSPPHTPLSPPPFLLCVISHRRSSQHHPPEPGPKPLSQGHQGELAPLCEKLPPIVNCPVFSARDQNCTDTHTSLLSDNREPL